MVWHVFPISGGYDQTAAAARSSWTFISSLLDHWFLPFLTVFLVSLGGWAIGMRNLVIYELENDSSRYLRALGASERVVRRYAYRNASLPQLSGLALALGVVIGGNIVTEIAFHYPGLGQPDLQRDRATRTTSCCRASSSSSSSASCSRTSSSTWCTSRSTRGPG